MDVDEVWKVKSNKRKWASSPTPLDNLGKVVSPTPWLKSFKKIVTLSPYKGSSSLNNVALRNIFRGIRNPLFLK
jgi:hypothetical protein